MSTQITCPVCQYTRKPTDDAPHWSCPQCNRAYAKTGKQRSGFCKNHFSTVSVWRCTDCGWEFCGECTKLHPGSSPVATCLECKGLCINISDAEKAANEEKEKNKVWKRGELASFVGVCLVLILGLMSSYYFGYRRGEAAAKRRLPYVIWYRWTVLDPKDDPPIKEMTVAHVTGGSRLSTKGYVAGNNAVVKEWLEHNKFIPFPPVSKASDLDMFR